MKSVSVMIDRGVGLCAVGRKLRAALWRTVLSADAAKRCTSIHIRFFSLNARRPLRSWQRFPAIFNRLFSVHRGAGEM